MTHLHRWWGRLHLALIYVLLLGFGSGNLAHAQFSGTAAANLQYESNSNIFDVQSGFTQPGANSPQASDTYFAYGAKFNVDYKWLRQDFYASAMSTSYDYQKFTQLDNTAYAFDAGWNWKLAQSLDGKLDVSRNRSMVPFYDLGQSSLSLQTAQRETANIGLKINSEWRLEAGSSTGTVDEPIQSAPNLQLVDTSSTLAVKYFGITGLTAGAHLGYQSGEYHGSNGVANPSYHQTIEGLDAEYTATGRTVIDGQIGYSKRSSASAADDTGGITGSLSVKDNLTPKTSLTVVISREINNYYANAGSEIDTDASIRAKWQATYKLGVAASYTYTYRDYPGQGNDPVGSNRIDHQQFINLDIEYRPQRWLVIKPYAKIIKRNSDFIGGDFSSNIYGVSVLFQTPNT